VFRRYVVSGIAQSLGYEVDTLAMRDPLGLFPVQHGTISDAAKTPYLDAGGRIDDSPESCGFIILRFPG
jgi:hypothetical protein